MNWRAIRSGFLAFTAFGLALFVYKYLDFLTRENPVRWYIPFIEEMTAAYGLALTSPIIIWMARRVPLRWPGSLRWLPLHVAVAVPLCFAQTTLFYVLRLAMFGILGLGVYDYGIMSIRYFMEMPAELMNYAVVAGFITYLDTHRRAHLLETELANAQLDKLRLQIQPHFLFNTLNAISAVVYEDPRKADEMLCRLSEHLRESLERDPKPEVRLEEELSSLRAYLDIMRARFEDGLQVKWEVDSGILSAVVPHFLLQPLAENSIRHGGMSLSISARRNGNYLSIELKDSGTGRTVGDSGMGIGLGNTRQRLARMYGTAGTVELEVHAERGAKVLVTVPYREAECTAS